MNKVGKKIQKILIVLIFIMGIAIFLLNKYVLQEMPIAERIGTATETSVTIEESLHIKTYSTTKYFSFLSDGEYEKAYQMLTDEYKAYMPYEQYLEKIKSFDYNNQGVKAVKQISQYGYIIKLENKDTKEETHYLVYMSDLNNKLFTISPDGFVYYDNKERKEESGILNATLKDYLIFEDSIQFKLVLKNKTSKELTIDDIQAELTKGGKINNKFESITLAAKEEREITFLVEDANYYIPKNVIIKTGNRSLKIDLWWRRYDEEKDNSKGGNYFTN